MPNVFVVQEPVRRGAAGVEERLMDLSPAAEFGELRFLLPRVQLPIGSDNWVPRIRSGLSSFNDDDYLLPVGDMAAITAAAAVAAQHNNGRIKVLKWSRHARRYVVQQLELFRAN